MEAKQLWIARDKDYSLFLYSAKPNKNGNRFIGEIDEDDYYALSIQLKKGLFPEVTFENSPQEVGIVLSKTHNKIWHDIDEEPIYVNGATPLIIDSNYGHVSREGHYYDQFQWKHHIEFQQHREFKWAYEKDLMNL